MKRYIVAWIGYQHASIRDLTEVVIDEITVIAAETLIRKSIDERKKNREELKERNRRAIEESIKSD